MHEPAVPIIHSAISVPKITSETQHVPVEDKDSLSSRASLLNVG